MNKAKKLNKLKFFIGYAHPYLKADIKSACVNCYRIVYVKALTSLPLKGYKLVCLNCYLNRVEKLITATVLDRSTWKEI